MPTIQFRYQSVPQPSGITARGQELGEKEMTPQLRHWRIKRGPVSPTGWIAGEAMLRDQGAE
ncbi:MAG: hypothetical protein KDE19_19635 [Caldilineaceae bacterium]|nr:hypothetical protein [Caldilineaceae bacterium]